MLPRVFWVHLGTQVVVALNGPLTCIHHTLISGCTWPLYGQGSNGQWLPSLADWQRMWCRERLVSCLNLQIPPSRHCARAVLTLVLGAFACVGGLKPHLSVLKVLAEHFQPGLHESLSG